jgi:hypothetical protein
VETVSRLRQVGWGDVEPEQDKFVCTT